MPRNEDGEFELILGNKQLLSVFFIVVILLGVFFTMGYIVGRNSAPVVAPDPLVTGRNESKPMVVESARPVETTPPVEPSAARPVTTQQQQPDPVKPEPAKPEPPKPEPPKPEPPKQVSKAADPPKPPVAAAKGSSEPISGQVYLQLSATRRAEADTYVDVLKKKGFTAIAAQVPENESLFRVLVGPVADADVNKTRADLQGAGFPGDKALRKKY